MIYTDSQALQLLHYCNNSLSWSRLNARYDAINAKSNYVHINEYTQELDIEEYRYRRDLKITVRIQRSDAGFSHNESHRETGSLFNKEQIFGVLITGEGWEVELLIFYKHKDSYGWDFFQTIVEEVVFGNDD